MRMYCRPVILQVVSMQYYYLARNFVSILRCEMALTMICAYNNWNFISFSVFNHGYLSSAFFRKNLFQVSPGILQIIFFKECVLQWFCASENFYIHRNTSTIFIVMIHISVKFFYASLKHLFIMFEVIFE